MAQHRLSKLADIPIMVRRSARAKRISLRVSGLDGRVTLTLPLGLAEREGLDFALQKSDWLRHQVASKANVFPVVLGVELPVEGQYLLVVQGMGREVVMSDVQIAVPGAADQVGRKLKGYLKTLARERLTAASDRYARLLGLQYRRLTLRDARSRWGSCSSQGALMYSWRLVMAPSEILDYVAAHEVAHLAQMNHTPAFWAVLGDLYGDYAPIRRWLHKNGPALHNFQFGD